MQWWFFNFQLLCIWDFSSYFLSLLRFREKIVVDALQNTYVLKAFNIPWKQSRNRNDFTSFFTPSFRVQCLGKISNLGWLVLSKGQFYFLLLSFLKFDVQTWWNNCYEANITYSTDWYINLSKWRPIRHRCGLLDGLTHPNLCSNCTHYWFFFTY